MRQSIHLLAAGSLTVVVVLTLWGFLAPATVQSGPMTDDYGSQLGSTLIWGSAASLVVPVALAAWIAGSWGWSLLVQRQAPWRARASDDAMDPSDSKLALQAALIIGVMWSLPSPAIGSALGILAEPRYPGWWVSIDSPLFAIRTVLFDFASTMVVFGVAWATARAYLAGQLERSERAPGPSGGVISDYRA